MNIVLVGFRCSGKSTVGRKLAERLGREFVDCDEYIEHKTHLSIREIFDVAGEPHFRNLESEALTDLTRRDGRVIATGGGAVLRYKNVRAMKRHGVVVYLEVEPETAFDRFRLDPASGERRPPLTQADLRTEIRLQMESRKPYYQSASDLTVKTDGRSIDRIVDEIIKGLKLKKEDGGERRHGEEDPPPPPHDDQELSPA